MSARQLLSLCRKAKILCVGSGDGSQQVALVKEGFTNLISTFYEPKETVFETHRNAEKNVEILDTHGRHPPLFQIDAAALHCIFPHSFADVVSFPFPHDGTSYHEHGSKHHENNQELIKNYLGSASRVIKPDGTIHVVLKDTPFYRKWHPSDEVLQAHDLQMSSITPFEPLEGHQPSTTRGWRVCKGRIPNNVKALVLSFVRKQE